MDHQQLIDSMIANNKNIRFATICNMIGEIQVTAQSKDIEKFLSYEQTKKSLENAVRSWMHARQPHFERIGMGLYTLTAYEKLKRVTVPLEDGYLLLFTMNNIGEDNQIISDVLKLVHED